MNAASVGVVLPLSGSKAGFGKRALFGIDQSIQKNALGKYKIHIADSKSSAAVGSYRVKELAESHFVSTIIGGLFPQEAMGEYLEAKKARHFVHIPFPDLFAQGRKGPPSIGNSRLHRIPDGIAFFQKNAGNLWSSGGHHLSSKPQG